MHSIDDIKERLNTIYADLESNVTHIYGRRDLHLAVDLVYHSPIAFNFEGRKVRKGYPEVLILGDTRTGKSQATEALVAHYGLGVTAQGENMTFAGLVGGVEQSMDRRWGVTWGKLPQNNRRLVILDEASGLQPEDIAKLSSIRSSGIATLEKIRNQSTESKTRLLWLSNPREGRTINQFSSGIHAIESLCPQPEDIARWDMALIVAKDDVKTSQMRVRDRKKTKHVYTSQLCHDLILWCWTRGADEVLISDETEQACCDFADRLSERFCSDFPLVIAAEQRIKMARLSIALAGRLFSTDDGKRIKVLPAHVEYIYHYLGEIYSSRFFGYDTWSANRMAGEHMGNLEHVYAILERIGRGGCLKLREMSKLQLRDFEETMGITADEAKTYISTLYINNAIKKFYGNYYHKTPEFNQLLTEYGKNGVKTKPREF